MVLLIGILTDYPISCPSKSLCSTGRKTNKHKCEIRSWEVLWRIEQRKRIKSSKAGLGERGCVVLIGCSRRAAQTEVTSKQRPQWSQRTAMQWPGTLLPQKTELRTFKEQAGRPFWPEQNERNGKWEKIRLERCEAL